MRDQERFLRALFNEDESICIAKYHGKKVYPLPAAIAAEWPVFVAANPLVNERQDVNVTSFRNLVIEFDEGTLEQQADVISSYGLPYTTLTYSGGKSLHAIIALNESVATSDEYRKLFRTINDVLFMIDPSCINPSRLTRIGGATRVESGVKQDLIDVRHRISLDDLYAWLRRYKNHLNKIEKKREQWKQEQAERAQFLIANGITGIDALPDYHKKFLEGDASGVKSRHKRFVSIAFKCLELGVHPEECRARLIQAHEMMGIPRNTFEEISSIINYVYFKQGA